MHERAFQLGVIEGFFGREWSWEARAAWASFSRDARLGLYVFAPKAERALRRAWREPFAPNTLAHLRELRSVYRDAGVGFGVGLTPFDVQRGLTDDDARALDVKLATLAELELDTLAVLFDDMRGDIPDLATSQLDIVARVRERLPGVRVVMCPTYYSDDPVLERVFGRRPTDYFDRLRDELPLDVDVFWTGPKVCSDEYPPVHLDAVRERFGRPVLLWDNYPVNDAERLVTKLHLAGLRGRDASLRDRCAGQLMNPMNQPFLSRVVVLAMAHALRDGLVERTESCAREIDELASPAVAALLRRDAARFASDGLDGLDDDARAQLIGEYEHYDDPMAREVVEWLRGGYAFDPACLTD